MTWGHEEWSGYKWPDIINTNRSNTRCSPVFSPRPFSTEVKNHTVMCSLPWTAIAERYFKFDGCTWWESQSSVGTERLEPLGFTPLSLLLPMRQDRAPLNRLLKHNRREAGRWKLYSGQGSLLNNSPTELDNASDKSTPLSKVLRSKSVEYQAPLRSFCTFSASFSCSCLCNGLSKHTCVNPNTF